MKHHKYLLLGAVGISCTLGQALEARAQPPENPQVVTPEESRAQWEQKQREAEARARQTPEGTLWQFAYALGNADLTLAARDVEGARIDGDLRKMQANLEKSPPQWNFGLAPLFAEAPEGKAEFEARVAVSLRTQGPLSDDAMLQSKVTFIERLTMRRDAKGEWKIVPRKAPALPAPPADESAQAQAQAVEASVKAAQSEDDGFFNTWARQMINPRELLRYSVSRASMSNVKQLLLGMLELNIDNDEVYAFTTDNFQEKVMPYVKSTQLFQAPTLDEAKPFAYTLNPSLAGKKLSQLDAPAQTVAVYEGAPDGKPVFRFGGKAVIGFADGHVSLVAPDAVPNLVWAIDPGPKLSG